MFSLFITIWFVQYSIQFGLFRIQYNLVCSVFNTIWFVQFIHYNLVCSVFNTIWFVQYSLQFDLFSIHYNLVCSVFIIMWVVQYSIQFCLFSIHYNLVCSVFLTIWSVCNKYRVTYLECSSQVGNGTIPSLTSHANIIVLFQTIHLIKLKYFGKRNLNTRYLTRTFLESNLRGQGFKSFNIKRIRL